MSAGAAPADAADAVAPDKGRGGRVAAATCPTPGGRTISGDHSNVNFSSWPAGSLRGANFAGATLRGAIFVGQDLTGASFQGADLGPSSAGPADFTNATLDGTCFIGATLDATDFTFAAMTCTDFSATSMIQAVFGPAQDIRQGSGCRTRFVGSTIDVGAIALGNWGRVDFTDARFVNLSPGSFSLAGADITGARLGCTSFTTPPAPGCKAFSGVDLAGANLTGVDLSGAVLVKARLDHAALNGVTLRRANLGYASLACARFHGSGPVTGCATAAPASADPDRAADLTQATLQYADLTRATLDFAVLTGANLAGATLRQASLQGATLEAGGSIGAATPTGADLTGAVLASAHLDHVQFNGAILVDARFGATTMNGTDFSGSIMPGADFTGAVLEGVTFYGTVLESAVFSGTTMRTTPGGGSSGVNFTCARLGGADFGDAQVTAANFTAAVMPPAPPGTTPPRPCCAQAGNAQWCGTSDATQLAYGPVVYPRPLAPIACPSGDVAACAGAQWVIPGWQTGLCSAARTTRTVWAPPDCGGPPGEYVRFNDANLKRCILDSLPGRPTEVTLQTAATLLAVSCPGRGIADLTGLERFTNLTSLDLTANRIAQFSLRLGRLQTLKISDNQLTLLDVSGLNATSPVRLEAANNQLRSVEGLAGVNLLVVDLSHNRLTGFDLPQQAASLTYADLSYNGLTGVLDPSNTGLGGMTLLNYLDLSNNSIAGIGSVAAIADPPPPGQASLLSLFLACNPTLDCRALGLPGGASPAQALLRSQCADFNSQTGQWIVLANPRCPTGAAATAAAARRSRPRPVDGAAGEAPARPTGAPR